MKDRKKECLILLVIAVENLDTSNLTAIKTTDQTSDVMTDPEDLKVASTLEPATSADNPVTCKS